MEKIIYGIHSIEEALSSQQEIEKIFFQKGINNPAIKKLLSKSRKQNISTSFVPIQKLNQLAKGNHQGAVALMSPIQTVSLENLVEEAFKTTSNPLFILLDEITDVRNFGAIIRTAECAGANGIIIPKQRSAAINEQVVKTSAGAIFNLPICKTNHLKDAIFFLQSYPVQIVAATEKATKNTVYDIDFNQPTALIMGSEGEGISKALLNLADRQAQLPILGKTASLNVSVACAVFLYEAVRQKIKQS